MLVAQNLSLQFGARDIFKSISISVTDGERIALLGENGMGKSTLLKVLAKELEPDAGSVATGAHQRVGFLRQKPILDANDTVWDAVRSGLAHLEALIAHHADLCQQLSVSNSAHLEEKIAEVTHHIEDLGGFDIDARVREVLSRFHVPAKEKKISELSGGEQRRVDLARLMLSSPDVLLLDEPTNHLDVDAIDFLAQTLNASRTSVIFISHDRAFVDQVATRILELDNGVLFTHPADYDTFLENKLTRKDIEVRSAHRKERLLARELVWLRASAPARTTKAKARTQSGQALIETVEQERQDLKKRRVQIESAKTSRLAKTILELDDVGFAYGDRVLFKHVTLKTVQGDCYGIVGPNGVGKTTLMSILAGQVAPTFGKIKVGPHTTMAIFDQHRTQLDPQKSLKETLANEGDFVFIGDRRMHIASFLERFLFSPKDINRKVETLSGGEQNRLMLAGLFKAGANCLLLDEPTNDLDVTTLGVLEEALLEHEGVSFIISHDRQFLDRVCTGIIAFEPGGVVVYQGNYSTYQRLKPQGVPAVESKPKALDAPAPSKAKTKRSYNEQREFESIEALIEKKEAEKSQLANLLSDGSLFVQDHQKAQQILQQTALLDEEIEKLFSRWQFLDDIEKK